MAYIANRPVRFDRDYRIGEIVPDAVIDPGMTRKLLDMGKIILTDISANIEGESTDTPSEAVIAPIEGDKLPDGINAQEMAENADTWANNGITEGHEGGGIPTEFMCEVCGKVCKNINALTAHMRTHKR
mgnify:CR=1 FL=1